MTREQTINSVCSWIVNIANDDEHGYSQAPGVRWGNPDYDCSALVISAWEQAGVKVKEAGASYTGDMKDAFVKCGFSCYNFSSAIALKKGDVLLTPGRHTAQYIGNGEIVHARGSENGTKYGQPGDQTGREILVQKYYTPSYVWTYILRYQGEPTPTPGGKKVMIETTQLKRGMKDKPEIFAVQAILKGKGYKDEDGKVLQLDSDFGKRTEYAVKKYQADHAATCGASDGIVGTKTWNSLINEK